MSDFIIGTRGSLLAKTQCTLFKQLLEKKSGKEFELKFITTQGDQQTDKPLWQMEGQNFFTKELDRALLNNEVDFVVHSYKDLGSIRPKGTEIACISKRVFPEDILLIKKDVITKLKDQNELIVGTSSPRRITNIENHLINYIPCNNDVKIKCKTLRGNVNSRIQKLLDGQYHMIVLAMAGLERLAQFPDSAPILKDLVKDLDFMILPQKSFPSAASQGALAVEVNVDSPRYEEIKAVLQHGHDEATAKCIKKEREIFNAYGGGCHLAVGIHVKTHKDQTLIIERGNLKDNDIHKIELEESISLETPIKNFIGNQQGLISQTPLDTDLAKNQDYFVTSKYCINHLPKENQTLWSSGARTHRLLAEKDFWVNGSADGLGHEEVKNYGESKLINLFYPNLKITVLSHDEATSDIGEVIPVYKREIDDSYQIEDTDFQTCFWGSFSHYKTYTEKYPELKDKKHSCGLGKTYDQFKAAGIEIIPVPSMLSLKKEE
jgi:hydroxymethylbilane synthase